MSQSGTRGVVGQTLTPHVVLKTVQAFGSYLGKGPVIVGGDTRTSHEMIKGAVISGLMSIGIDVIDIGKVPTPTVQQMIRHHKATGGIVITASHNPIVWNGLKLMNASGSFMNVAEYAAFMKFYESDKPALATWSTVGKIRVDETAIQKHIDLILSVIDPTSIQKAGLRAAIDPNNGAACIADKILMERLNVKYDIIHGDPTGVFSHNPEPVKGNLQSLMAFMQEGNYDIGFGQDADADRLVILDEKGGFIGEDYSLAFCVDYILSQEKSSDKRVVVNLSTSQVIDFVARKHGAAITHTKIGESHVTEGIRKEKACVGGEGNGGVIYPKVGWGRDSLVGIVVALKHLAEKKQTVSQIVSTYPSYTMLREKIEAGSKDEVSSLIKSIETLFKEYPQNTQDGVKVIMPESWVHVRPSNTEPIVRIFIETPASQNGKEIFEKIQRLFLK